MPRSDASNAWPPLPPHPHGSTSSIPKPETLGAERQETRTPEAETCPQGREGGNTGNLIPDHPHHCPAITRTAVPAPAPAAWDTPDTLLHKLSHRSGALGVPPQQTRLLPEASQPSLSAGLPRETHFRRKVAFSELEPRASAVLMPRGPPQAVAHFRPCLASSRTRGPCTLDRPRQCQPQHRPNTALRVQVSPDPPGAGTRQGPESGNQ